MTTATIVALTVACCWLVYRDHRREVAARGQAAVIRSQAATIIREREAAARTVSGTPIHDALRRRHDEFARDLARIHQLDEWRGER